MKGRLLDERDVARVARLCLRSGLIYEVTLIYLPPNAHESIEKHRAEQCEGLTSKLTEQHHPDMIAGVQALRFQLEQLPLQLYVQSVATLDVVWRTLKHATMYHSQRDAAALARLSWIFDAKQPRGVTGWEQWWTEIVKPLLQSQSLREPFPQIEEGDYSQFPSKEVPVPDYLVKECPEIAGKMVYTLGPIFEGIKFLSEQVTGLELVDVLTNSVRRAVTGNLQVRGWEGISRTMIHRAGQTYVGTMAFGPQGQVAKEPAASVLRGLGKGGRQMSK